MANSSKYSVLQRLRKAHARQHGLTARLAHVLHGMAGSLEIKRARFVRQAIGTSPSSDADGGYGAIGGERFVEGSRRCRGGQAQSHHAPRETPRQDR
jgi:hypothetical protein